MKRFISILLVSMLLVGCLSTVAFAESTEKTGSATFTVKGEFVNFSGTVSAKSPLVITEIVGITGNPANGMVAWAGSDNNYKEISFTVKFKLPAGATCGTYGVSASIAAKKNVYDDAGVKTGTEPTSASVSGGGSITIDHIWDNGVVQTPATCGVDGVMLYTCTVCGHTKTETIPATGNHTWGAWTETEAPSCTKEGSKERVCSVCNAVETQPIAKLPHDHKTLKYDENGHWHECDCGDKTPVEAHDLKIEKNDTHHWEICSVCGYKTAEVAHNLEWKYNNDQHWKVCEDCGYMTAPEDHDHDANGKCECGHTKSTGGGGSSGNDPVPDMGDATPYGTYNMMVAAVVITLFGTVALVEKRKNAK